MSVSFTQEARLGQLHTDLGPDVLVLLRFSGADFVNGLFEYRVEAMSTRPDVDMNDLIGTHAVVEFKVPRGKRLYDGVITTAVNMGTSEQGNRYDLVLRPWFWLAGQRRNQRIFHELTVVEILEEVLNAYTSHGSPHLDTSKLTGSYPTLEYTVQYRESDLQFCLRMMQQFAISYYFRHEEGGHVLVLSDDAEGHEEVPNSPIRYHPVSGHSMGDEEHFSEWRSRRSHTVGAIRTTAYNFKTPDAVMEVDRTGDAEYAEGQIESFDFPGGYLDEGGGKEVVAKRILQERIKDDRHSAFGNCMTLCSGQTFELSGDDLPKLDGKRFLCMSATHNYTSEGYGSSSSRDSSGVAFTGTYEMIPLTVPLVPERTAPQPVVHGPQTAVVVGDGQIDCDEHGRILVKFHWDLAGAHSMRCRVSQNWAHKGWGGMVIPRIGMEVIVEFIEGDPSLPIVTGCVYNGKNTPPYPLPANKTRTVFKTNSHEASGFNEIRFEDAGGSEELWIHSQKDRNEKTLNNHSEEIDVDWSQVVGNDKTINVGNDHTETIGHDESRTTGNDQTVTVGNNHTENIGNDRTDTIGNNVTVTVGKDQVVITGANLTETVGANHDITVGANATETVAANKKITVGGNLTITVGGTLTITCGGSSMVLKQDGTIGITGKKFLVSASSSTTMKTGKMNVKSDGKIVMKGSKIDMN